MFTSPSTTKGDTSNFHSWKSNPRSRSSPLTDAAMTTIKQGKENISRSASKDTANAYESQRRANIEANQALLRELGLHSVQFNSLLQPEHSETENVPPKTTARRVHRPAKMKVKEIVQVARKSRRIRGEAAMDEAKIQEDVSRTIVIEEHRRVRGEYSRSLWKGKKQTTSFEATYEIPENLGVPITLGSIGTTIWDLGKLRPVDEHAPKYWSTSACLFKHPYPIGYRATKQHFNHEYTMTIDEGPEGPIFTVKCDNGIVFTGVTPTAPWTDACKKSNSSGTRVSGPLFYGFSDPITMRLIESMPGYDAVLEAEQERERLKEEARQAKRMKRTHSNTTDSSDPL